MTTTLKRRRIHVDQFTSKTWREEAVTSYPVEPVDLTEPRWMRDLDVLCPLGAGEYAVVTVTCDELDPDPRAMLPGGASADRLLGPTDCRRLADALEHIGHVLRDIQDDEVYMAVEGDQR